MTDQADGKNIRDLPLAQQWEIEQQNWQQMLLSYADSAARDESFLIHLGNAMRGSLLAGKPYPGTSSEPPQRTNATMANDEVVFLLRRLDGQVNELAAAVDALTRRIAAVRAPEDQP